jgi:hypothetical protein
MTLVNITLAQATEAKLSTVETYVAEALGVSERDMTVVHVM